ncbi:MULTISPECIES: biofilm formation regulator BssS [Xenorhabdus]|uniref:Biofilm formation regulatory protein BssS n=2 Tax=Xenorhabdus TaxID=626 RepID=A0A2D0IX19_9GAMM|nr:MULTISPECIES: biofilm formation regulator BssS [Xenorhabdus]BET96612.1 biofilm formation regulator BssS [Xenorhabdus sp. TCT-1]MBC8950367.1 biofilm formation regulatory protein BssS [Xenorhabdus sp. TS4]MBE8595263.1 biofilm formation regulator BssS [Xenorhabdus sp. BG5]PHM26318.1 biofilm formation regulatory protein BssS [Xenorhabdus ehlersii]RKE91569.1 biofilm regulator BssS [Xenorhabdus ehlersii]
MGKENEIIQTHPVVGWDISIVDAYDAMMIRLHYSSTQDQTTENVSVDKTLWLTTGVAKQLILILQAGIEKIESSEYSQLDHIKH